MAATPASTNDGTDKPLRDVVDHVRHYGKHWTLLAAHAGGSADLPLGARCSASVYDLAPRFRTGQSGRTMDTAERWRFIAKVLRAGGVFASLLISGMIWAASAVVAGAAFDGEPAEYYDGGNRFAFAVAFLVLAVVCPLLCLIGYGFARSVDWSPTKSFAAAQLPAVVVAAGVVWLLA